jgi:hypothetical protein
MMGELPDPLQHLPPRDQASQNGELAREQKRSHRADPEGPHFQ